MLPLHRIFFLSLSRYIIIIYHRVYLCTSSCSWEAFDYRWWQYGYLTQTTQKPVLYNTTINFEFESLTTLIAMIILWRSLLLSQCPICLVCLAYEQYALRSGWLRVSLQGSYIVTVLYREKLKLWKMRETCFQASALEIYFLGSARICAFCFHSKHSTTTTNLIKKKKKPTLFTINMFTWWTLSFPALLPSQPLLSTSHPTSWLLCCLTLTSFCS